MNVQKELFEIIREYADFKAKTFSKHGVKDVDAFSRLQIKINQAKNIQEINIFILKMRDLGIKSMINLYILIKLYRYLEENAKRLQIKEVRFLKENHIIDFLSELSLKYKASTIANFKINLGIFFRYLDRKKGFNFDFQLKISLGKQKILPKFLPKEKFFHFIDYLKNTPFRRDFEKRNRLIILIVTYSGLRSSEVRNLRLCDIQNDENNYCLKVNGKGNKERVAIIKKDLIEKFLQEWLHSETRKRKRKKHSDYLFLTAKNNDTTRYFLNKTLKKLGYLDQNKSAGLHMLRHSFGSYIYGETKDLILTQNALGHSSIETTKIYIHTNNDYCRQVANLFN